MMSIPREQTYPALLWHALNEQGLIATRAEVESAQRAIVGRGRQHVSWARSLTGTVAWWRGLWASGYPFPRRTVIRILGVGHLMTEFLIAPLHLSGPAYDAAVRMGVLSNLIATLYDAFLDYGYLRHNPIPENVLTAVVDATSRQHIAITRREENAPYRFMISLIRAYFDQADALPYAADHQWVVKTLTSAIRRMYHAQNVTASLRFGALDAKGRRALRGKSIYPIMVMGLPAWLAMQDIPVERYRWHQRWMCRLGYFFGWVDDAVDLWLDSQTDQPNLISDHRAALGAQITNRTALTHVIAARGRKLIDEWVDQVGDVSAVPLATTNIVPTTLYGWFGSPPQPSTELTSSSP